MKKSCKNAIVANEHFSTRFGHQTHFGTLRASVLRSFWAQKLNFLEWKSRLQKINNFHRFSTTSFPKKCKNKKKLVGRASQPTPQKHQQIVGKMQTLALGCVNPSHNKKDVCHWPMWCHIHGCSTLNVKKSGVFSLQHPCSFLASELAANAAFRWKWEIPSS